jgi:hypothetical protein
MINYLLSNKVLFHLRRDTIVEIEGRIFYIILMLGCANKAVEAHFFFFKDRKQARKKIYKLLLLLILLLRDPLKF